MTEPYTLTFGEIRLRVMKQLRLPINNSDVQDQIMTVINEVYRDIAAKQDWWWLLKHAAQATATYDAFPVSSSATITVAGDGQTALIDPTTLPQSNQDLTQWAVLIPGLATDPGAVFRIASYNDQTTTITFDAPLTIEDTDQLSPNQITVNIYNDSIRLPSGVSKLLQVRRYGYWQPMVRVGIEEMMQVKEYDQSVGPPQIYSIYDALFTGLSGLSTAQRFLQIHPYPNHQYRLDLYYKEALTTDLNVGTIPLMPSEFQQTLIYGTLSRGYPIFLNDTERGAYYLSLFNDLMVLMAAQQKEYAKDQSGIRPDMMGYARTNSRIRPRTSYTLGRLFDTLPNIP